mmetsp:Transcript_37521/g.113125  ORF Transcript_37521/g.113125 Transcript_37521/m.113125 type:complete len:426 (+) Transcript_37521:818-2095(+)
MPALHDEPHVARRDGRAEGDGHLGVAVAVGGEGGLAVDARVIFAILAHLHSVVRHPLVEVRSTLRLQAGHLHDCAGVDGHVLVAVVILGGPRRGRVEHGLSVASADGVAVPHRGIGAGDLGRVHVVGGLVRRTPDAHAIAVVGRAAHPRHHHPELALIRAAPVAAAGAVRDLVARRPAPVGIEAEAHVGRALALEHDAVATCILAPHLRDVAVRYVWPVDIRAVVLPHRAAHATGVAQLARPCPRGPTSRRVLGKFDVLVVAPVTVAVHRHHWCASVGRVAAVLLRERGGPFAVVKPKGKTVPLRRHLAVEVNKGHVLVAWRPTARVVAHLVGRAKEAHLIAVVARAAHPRQHLPCGALEGALAVTERPAVGDGVAAAGGRDDVDEARRLAKEVHGVAVAPFAHDARHIAVVQHPTMAGTVLLTL